MEPVKRTSAYAQPNAKCPQGCPCLAARANHRTASGPSFSTPRPSCRQTPISCCAAARPSEAAWCRDSGGGSEKQESTAARNTEIGQRKTTKRRRSLAAHTRAHVRAREREREREEESEGWCACWDGMVGVRGFPTSAWTVTSLGDSQHKPQGKEPQQIRSAPQGGVGVDQRLAKPVQPLLSPRKPFAIDSKHVRTWQRCGVGGGFSESVSGR